MENACELPPEGELPGQFDDYELLGILGRGAMAVVYKARQVSLQRIVALKMLRAYDAEDPFLATRLRIEAEATASLHHPNIVTVYEVGNHEGQPFISMEFVAGRPMNQFIGPGGFRCESAWPVAETTRRGPQAAIAWVLNKIAWAVDHAHKHGVLHRDLKPANILMDQKGEPHLTDFGLAKILGREMVLGSKPGSLQGTPAFMSPEQAEGGQVSTVSDVYSLGATLYNMLTGQPPFKARTVPETLQKLLSGPPKHPCLMNGLVDPDLATICMKCLEPDPQRRYSSAQALAEELERWLRGEPIEARPARALERIWRWGKREPVLASLTAGVVLLVGAIAILTFTLDRRERAFERGVSTQRAFQQGKLVQRLKDEWQQRDRRGIRLDAAELATLRNHEFVLEGRSELFVGVAAPFSDSHPINRAQRHMLFLEELSRGEGTPLEQIVFGLYLYKSQDHAIEGLAEDPLALLRLTSTAYVLLSQQQSNVSLTPVVQQFRGLRGAIFVRVESGITHLQQLKGKSFVLGDRDSSLGHYFPKAELAAAGLRAADLKCITNILSTHVISAVNRSSTFLPTDLRDAASFALKLRSPEKDLSADLRRRLDEPTRRNLERGDKVSFEMLGELITNLNKIVEGPSIWEPSLFASVALRPETQKLCEARPTGTDLVRLNRLLLEDAYPQEIERHELFDAGVAEVEDLRPLIKSGVRLRIVKEFDCPGYIWAATPRLSQQPVLLEALRQRLLSGSAGAGFAPIDPAEFDQLVKRIEQASAFDRAN